MNRPRHLYPIVLFLLLLLTASVTSCRRDAAFHDALLRAEALMETDPQQARALLDSIASPNLNRLFPPLNPPVIGGQKPLKGRASESTGLPSFRRGKEEAALYALLRTQADYKCRVRLTSDSLPLIATNYYGTKRKSQRAALAQYYLGCTYSDMHRNLDAIDALLRATTLFPDTTNKYYANSLFELGLLYRQQNMFDSALVAFRHYRQTDVCHSDSVNIGLADYNMGLTALFKGEDLLADSLFLCVMHNTKNSAYMRNDINFQLAKQYFYRKHDAERASEYLEKYMSYAGENSVSLLLCAEIQAEKHEPLQAYTNYRKGLKKSKDLSVRCTAYKGLAYIAPLLDKTDSARYFMNQYEALLDSIYAQNQHIEIDAIKNNHVIEIHNQQLKARHARFMFWMGILAVVLLSGTAITFLLIDRKRKKRYLQAQEELRQANVEVLRAQVDEQPADLDALYRKKLAACQKLFRRTPSARLLLVPPASLTAAQRQTLMDDLTRSFVDIMLDVKNASNAVNDQELMYCILSSLQCSTAQMAELLNTTESTLRSRKARLKEKMPDNLHALFLS